MANTNQTAEEQEAIKRKRVFKKFQFRGVDLDKLVRTGSERTCERAGGRASQACAEAAQRVGARARAYAYARARERGCGSCRPGKRAGKRTGSRASRGILARVPRSAAHACRRFLPPASLHLDVRADI